MKRLMQLAVLLNLTFYAGAGLRAADNIKLDCPEGTQQKWENEAAFCVKQGLDGQPVKHGPYSNSKPEDNYVLKETGYYWEGKQHGTWVTWALRGNIAQALHYRHGVKEGSARYGFDRIGPLFMELFYVTGQSVYRMRGFDSDLPPNPPEVQLGGREGVVTATFMSLDSALTLRTRDYDASITNKRELRSLTAPIKGGYITYRLYRTGIPSQIIIKMRKTPPPKSGMQFEENKEYYYDRMGNSVSELEYLKQYDHLNVHKFEDDLQPYSVLPPGMPLPPDILELEAATQ